MTDDATAMNSQQNVAQSAPTVDSAARVSLQLLKNRVVRGRRRTSLENGAGSADPSNVDESGPSRGSQSSALDGQGGNSGYSQDQSWDNPVGSNSMQPSAPVSQSEVRRRGADLPPAGPSGACIVALH